MAESETKNGEDKGLDRSRELLEQLEPRRVIPKATRDGLKGLLVGEETLRSRREKGGVILEEIPPRERVKKPKEGPFSSEERELLNLLEKDVVTVLIRDAIKPGRDMVASFKNIYPYDTRYTVDIAVNEMNELINDIHKLDIDTSRSREMLQELDAAKSWIDGTRGLLAAGGTTLQTFFDGLATMAGAIRTNPRHNLTATELHGLYSAMSEIKDWGLGEELTCKQDQIHDIMRGVAAAYRHRSRNMGQEIENDYPVTDEQVEFVNKVFASGKEKSREVLRNEEELEEVDTVPEEVEAIKDITSKRLAIDEIRVFYDQASNYGKSVRVVRGWDYVITRDFIQKTRQIMDELKGNSLWVDGVQWPINEQALKELEWKIDSGDRVFLGDIYEVKSDKLDELEEALRDFESVAVLTRIPAALDGLFTTTPVAEKVDDIKRKMIVMMELGIWDRLSHPEVDVDREVELLKREKETSRYKSRSLEDQILSEHLLEMARIYLLYSCEGARLNWGFEYQFDKDLGTFKRSVTSSGTEVSTDIATPFHWLYSEANNSWKEWTHGILPMDKRVQRQIRDHEPGWKPAYNASNGWWRVTYLGAPLDIDARAKFDLSLLDSAKVEGGRYDGKKGFDLIRENMKMSEIPWKKFSDMVVNRWYITLSQLAMAVGVLNTQPGGDLTKKFFGEPVGTPRTTEYLELIKREFLAHRDAAKYEDLEKFLPLSLALHEAWEDNILPTSLQPGMFVPGRASRENKMISISLRQLAPEGDKTIAGRMANRFDGHARQLIEIGKRVSKDISKQKLASYLKR